MRFSVVLLVSFLFLALVGLLLWVYPYITENSQPEPNSHEDTSEQENGFLAEGTESVDNPKSVLISGTCVNTLLAVSHEERVQGLSGRQSLQDNQGMLFIYEKEGNRSIWMKDMLFSLDIIWLDSDRQVIDFVQNITPETFPESFASKSPARYVLEVSAGFIQDHEITVGEDVVFESELCK